MIVTVEELQNYMDIGKLSPKATIGVGFILAGLESELELYLGRPINIGTFTESYRILEEPLAAVMPFYSNTGVSSYTVEAMYPNRRTIALRRSPVLSVISVYVTQSGGASVGLNPSTDFGVRRFGIDVWNPVIDDEYTITYTAGLDNPDYPILKNLILRAAAREAQNMYDDNKGIQQLEPREATVAITGFSDAELRSVKRLKRVRY
jgi:hypothetical protein